MDERQAFGTFVKRYGTVRPGPAKPAEYQVPNGACWDATWAAAEAHDTHYVEGICFIAGTGGQPGRMVNAHAWEERDTPFGTVVVEHTAGYANIVRYLGCRIARPAARSMSADWGEERVSVLEFAIVQGWSPDQILDRLVTR